MKPSEFAWSTLQSITQKHPGEIKLLLDDQEYPSLDSDPYGYVLHLSMPRKKRDGLYNYLGMYFDTDARGRASLWRMFRAAAYHLCLHAITTDYGIYQDLSQGYPSRSNLMFAISLVEDYAVRGHMRGRWPGLLLDSAYASQISWLRMKNKGFDDPAMSLAANLLSYSLVGKAKFSMGEEIDQQLESIHRDLVGFESSVKKYYSPAMTSGKKESGKEADAPTLADLNYLRLEKVQKVLDFLRSHLYYLSIVPAAPFTDNHGPNELFEGMPEEGDSEQLDNGLGAACSAYSLVMTQEWMEESEKEARSESENVLEGWEYSLTVMKRLVELHKGLDRDTHFENFLFPAEDYSEFVRSRSRNIGPIRLVLDHLRAIYSIADDTFNKESGYIDIPLAVQLISSEAARRNDVFIQEEIQKKSETWAILIDASKSLATYQREVRDVAVCLGEVAKDLIPNQNSWACYAFNENFFIVKDFSEAYNNTTKARIGGLSSGLQTYLPDALNITAKRLINTPGDIKVLMVASDGFPLGYQGIERKLAQTIEKIGRSGIQLVGLGVGSSSIRNYFRSNCEVNSPSDLMKHFVKMYFELSASF